MSRIEWTEKTWNPVHGCSRVSPGCDNCYAMRFEHRFSGPGGRSQGFTKHRPKTAKRPGVDWTGLVSLIPERLDVPLRRRKPTTWFVNSTSDLFHGAMSNEEIAEVFRAMAWCPQHRFQILTKRAERLPEWHEWVKKHLGRVFRKGDPGPEANHWPLRNVWLGVSCEDQQRADERIPHLLATPAAIRFVSAEPLLGPINFWLLSRPITAPRGILGGLDWVIVGGESGPGARPCDVDWIRDIVAECKRTNVACFVKQLGAKPMIEIDLPRGADLFDMKLNHRKGGDITEWPKDLQVRQMP